MLGNRQSRGPHLGPHSRALTGSLLVGLSPSLLIPALQPTLAVMEEVSRLCCSSPPREHAGPDRLIAVPSPVPRPTLVFILEQSMLKAWVPPGASHTLAQCGLLCVSRWAGHKPDVMPQSLPLHPGRGQPPREGSLGSKTPTNQEWHQIIPQGISKATGVLVRASLTDVPRPFSCVSGGRRCSINLE